MERQRELPLFFYSEAFLEGWKGLCDYGNAVD